MTDSPTPTGSAPDDGSFRPAASIPSAQTVKPAGLIARLEAAEVGSRELDSEIVLLLDLAPAGSFRMYGVEHGTWGTGPYSTWVAPHFTTSLDAALALAERVLPTYTATLVVYRTNGGEFPPHSSANLLCPYGEITEYRGDAKTAPLALCAAILKATGEPR